MRVLHDIFFRNTDAGKQRDRRADWSPPNRRTEKIARCRFPHASHGCSGHRSPAAITCWNLHHLGGTIRVARHGRATLGCAAERFQRSMSNVHEIVAWSDQYVRLSSLTGAQIDAENGPFAASPYV